MNNARDIQQLFIACESSGPVILGQSEGISFGAEEFARRAAVEIASAAKVWPKMAQTCALPAGPDLAAVITSIPEPSPEAVGTPRLLQFLLVPLPLYRWLGDPFLIADRFPANPWSRGRLPLLEWPDEPRPPRRVADAQAALKNYDGSLLLAAAQALVDGAKVRIVRPQPEPGLVRAIWTLLPDVARAEIFPAEFDPGMLEVFGVAVVPTHPAAWPPGTLDDEQVRNYPEGRFELAMQLAAEAGDQAAYDRLLSRRSPREVLRWALLAILFALGTLAALRLVG